MAGNGKTNKTGGVANVASLTEPAEQEKLIALFESIAAAEGWQPGNALRRYYERSIYLAALLDGQMQGGAQLVLPSPTAGLPGRDVWPEVDQAGDGPAAHVTVLGFRSRNGKNRTLRLFPWAFLPLSGSSSQ